MGMLVVVIWNNGSAQGDVQDVTLSGMLSDPLAFCGLQKIIFLLPEHMPVSVLETLKFKFSPAFKLN